MCEERTCFAEVVWETRETATFRLPLVEDVYYCPRLVLETLVMPEIELRDHLLYLKEAGTFGLGNVDSVTLNDVLDWMVAVGTLKEAVED